MQQGSKVQGEGEGEWKVKIPLAIDARTQQSVGEVSTGACADDGKAFPDVIRQIFHPVKMVIGDGRDLIHKKGGRSLIPPPSNTVCHATDLERHHAILAIRGFGGDKVAKSIWG